MTTAQENRKAWIDLAKGICILLVVFSHSAHGYKIYVLDTVLLSRIIESTYLISLHSFFFLSGLFAVKLLNRRFIDVFNAKVSSILIPYIIWAAILGIMKILFSNNVVDPLTWKDILYIPVKPIGITWFLYVLFLCYITYKLLSIKLNMFAIFTLSIIFLFLRSYVDILVVHRFFHYFAFFVCGAALNTFIYGDNTRLYFKVWIAIPVMLVLQLYFSFDHINILRAISGIYLIISLAVTFEKYEVTKRVSYIGSLSLIIYLVHMIPETAFRIVLLKYFHMTNIYLYLAIQVILTTSICLLFNNISERLGVRRYLFGR